MFAIKLVTKRSVFPRPIKEPIALLALAKYVSPMAVLICGSMKCYLVTAGNTSKKTAVLLDKSLKTAENHCRNIDKKLPVNSSAV
ncbi:MAG: DNA-binding CsgD family transcriptional regulator [Paraglaciecola sp.]|jgi:DNA-binding CsgD family transcriptional regulator